MRRDKEFIFKLRQEGNSYRQIENKTGVSRATLTAWFGSKAWSTDIMEQHRSIQNSAATERMIRMNMVRKLKLQYYYAQAEAEAKREFELYKTDQLFNAGLMLYAGEGERATKDKIRLANADVGVHETFLLFLEKYLGFARGYVKFWLFLYPDLDETMCKAYWKEELGLSEDQFYKTYTGKARIPRNRLLFGTGTTILSSAFAKKKLMLWIALAFVNYKEAGMVQG